MSGTALLFPGQGSQYVGMGRDLAEDDGSIRELYEFADELIRAPISRLSWKGPEEDLMATQNAQPAILLHSYAVWRLVGERVSPVTAAGHSLGELTAHLIAGTLGFEDALRVVRTRGELMAASGADRPGTMSVVLGLDLGALDEICAAASRDDRKGVVVPANLNAPGQIVISGDVRTVKAAGARALEAGARRVVPLKVSGAFHSPLMAGASEGLDAALGEASLADPTFPVIATATAEPVTDAETARQTLVAQLTSPVRWIEVVDRIRQYEPSRWLEIGPGAVLSGLVRRIDREQRVRALGDSASVDAFLGAVE